MILNGLPPRVLTATLVVSLLPAALGDRVRAQEDQARDARAADAAARLTATQHPPLPSQPSQYWYVPEGASRSAVRPLAESATARLARASTLIAAGQHAQALALIDVQALASTPLAAYASYYSGVALMGLSRVNEAEAAFAAAAARRPAGFVKEALVLRAVDIAFSRQDAKRAYDVLNAAKDDTLSAPEEIFLQLGRAAERAGRRDDAVKAYRRVYYDFPMSAQASDAQSGLERLESINTASDRVKPELARAEKLFAAKRWAQARAAFDVLSRVLQGDDKELVALRVAECDYYLDRFRAARDGVRPYLKGGPREAEARFFHLTATRALGFFDEYVTLARGLVADVPQGSWAEETLNNLASHYIKIDDDEAADGVFRQLYTQLPTSRYAERAAWRIGWRLYRNGHFRDTAELFEAAAANYARSDYRPSWIYWAGRSRDQIGERQVANDRYRLAVADYENSYYGRLSSALLEARKEPKTFSAVDTTAVAAAPATREPVPSDTLIRALVAGQMYDDALREVQYAQRVWGDSPQLQATTAFIRHNQGLALTATERFSAIRGAITTMRRAYPQFMAQGGEQLPPDVLRIIFPLDFWPLITKYSKANDLDPYLVAALMAQESTFTPEIRSAADAYGLMQLVPAAGRQYARKLGLRYSPSLLTQAEPNVRMGTLYLKDLADRFGGVHFALASYNAGPHRVSAWLKEKPSLPMDEFIDDIPFPETQTYVKRILGTAEDYRRLYGGGLLDPNASLSLSSGARSSVAPARPATSKVAPAKKATKKPAVRRPVRKPTTAKPATPATRRR